MSSCHRNFSVQTKLIHHIRRNKAMYRLASCVAICTLAPRVLGVSWLVALAGCATLYLLTGGSKWVKLFWKTMPRDLKLGKAALLVELSIKKWVKNKVLVVDVFKDNALKFPDKLAFVCAESGETLTYKEAVSLINRISNVFFEAGYQKGDVVALVMENRVEYMPVWLGLSHLGITCALINFNLRGDSLKHCIEVSDCKAIIYSKEMELGIQQIASQLKLEFYSFFSACGSIENAKSLQILVQSASELPPPRPTDLSLLDKMLYIYTSGTTGLPKAAVIRGTRFSFMSLGIGLTTGINNDDIVYNSLPLYHSNGGVAVGGQVIHSACTLVLRKRFSASRFFEDCCKHNVTVINYIGETCRYLLAQPRRDFDEAHKVRIATGNGLRSSIWKDFKERFNIGLIAEFYGATEGNANMINNVGRVGSVGFNSLFFPWVNPIKLIKVDKDTGEIIRDANGIAITAQPGEIGELVGKVCNDAMRQFDGYVNKASTEKKIAYDIFQKGDSAFMTGDFLLQDEEGFYYFQDRTGDTFRWKGENVSTNEVEGVITKELKLSEVCVYGVEVPKVEGKAGMACICDPERKMDLDELQTKISNALPPYARPVFIRLQSNELAKTSTFKFQKVSLRKEGFNPMECGADDHLYYFSCKEKRFLPIDADVYAKIANQEIRF